MAIVLQDAHLDITLSFVVDKHGLSLHALVLETTFLV
jgi:hypothetical protein